MSKLTLIAKAILADVKNPDIPEEKKLETIEEGMKAFAVESVNMLHYLRENNITQEIIAGVMDSIGIVWDGRAKKFK